MSFIEGIGDEVTLFFVISLIFFLAALVTLIGNGPTLSNVRTRQQLRRSPERESDALHQNPEIFTTTVAHQAPERSVPPRAEPQSFDDFINEGVAEISNPAEEQSSTEANGNVDSSSLPGVATRTEAGVVEEERPTGSESAGEDAVPMNSDAPSSVEELDASGTATLNSRSSADIRVRLKYLDDTERIVVTSPSTKIGDFKKTHFSEDIRSNKVVRLIFAGRLLHNTSTIHHCRILDNSVVHVQVLPAPTVQNGPAASREVDVDLGRFLWPLITVILGLCWVTFFKYPEFYNTMSLWILLLFSGCFFYFLSQMHR